MKKIKTFIKKLLQAAVNNNFLWIFIKPIAKFGFFAIHSRKETTNVINHGKEAYLDIFEAGEVLHGPFAGMKYPSFSSAGSAFYPKLLGSYEKELHHIIDEFLLTNYSEILDIGCAEGYYAIGMALKSNAKRIYAYDTEEAARDLCNQMANINNVTDKVEIKKTCTARELEEFKFMHRGLIICDCEGYEQDLFNERNIGNLKNCDLIIETHDFVNLNISGNLIGLFSKTHDIQIIKSIDDIEKSKTYLYPETNGLRLEDKMKLFRECRPAIMEWLICIPRVVNIE